jgi:PAT family beta-lactamase induction signal transducer AmpG
MAIAAAAGAFASATQDISIDTWRIEVADAATPMSLLSAVSQFGYRVAAFIGGAGALFLADALPVEPGLWDWRADHAAGDAGRACGTRTAGRPNGRNEKGARKPRLASSESVGGACRYSAAWAWAAIVLVTFMASAVATDPPPDAKAFTQTFGPIIVIATVIFPCALAAAIAHVPAGRTILDRIRYPDGVTSSTDRLYEAIVEPFVELMSRLKWAAVLVLAVILSYRLTDAVWGPFAFPFYLYRTAIHQNRGCLCFEDLRRGDADRRCLDRSLGDDPDRPHACHADWRRRCGSH